MRKLTIKWTIFSLVALGLVVSLAGCGASLQRASHVQSAFANSTELKERVSALCSQLKARTEEPRLEAASVMDSICTTPAQVIQAFNPQATQLGFTKAEAVVVPVDAGRPILDVKVLAEVSLGQTLLKSVSQLLQDFGDRKDDEKGRSEDGFILRTIEEPKMEKGTFRLAGVLELESLRQTSHLVDIKNRVNLVAEVIDGSVIVATLQGVRDESFEVSLIKNLRITIIAVPVGDDVYMAIGANFKPYTFGANQELTREFFESLAKSLIEIPRLFHGLMGK